MIKNTKEKAYGCQGFCCSVSVIFPLLALCIYFPTTEIDHVIPVFLFSFVVLRFDSLLILV